MMVKEVLPMMVDLQSHPEPPPDEKQNEFQSLDMKNIPKNINALKKGVSEPKSSWDKFTGGNKLGRQ